MSANERARVTVFSLGGTIASTGAGRGEVGGVTSQLGARELVDAVAQLPDVADVTSVSFRQFASGDLTLSDLVALAREITASLDGGATGVVVTQGTDTLEEAAFALDLLVRRPQPVVVTGAMRNPTLAGPDGPANLLAAVRVAAAPDAVGLGTLVVLNDEIHAARFVRKTHTSSPSTFQSPTVGALGWLVEGRVRIVFRLSELVDLSALDEYESAPVALLTSALGDDGRLIEHIERLGYAGLVVEGFGGGHVPARVVPALEALAARVPVVLTSRTGAGEVLRETYGFAGSERDLLSRGLISGGFLDGPKARILLSLLLSGEGHRHDVRAVFEKLS